MILLLLLHTVPIILAMQDEDGATYLGAVVQSTCIVVVVLPPNLPFLDHGRCDHRPSPFSHNLASYAPGWPSFVHQTSLHPRSI